ncbi:MAG: UDP-N-acetylmuramoyl-L-alanyl-D-glutamate--2,6-diaminopimelate ligase [Clostridiales bacterium]|nr:UDP-N-acetylmuramoyl-L-alanyl-D-glutamate--2,6-diaminopimelate ligase [Clostridiales bacterium]
MKLENFVKNLDFDLLRGSLDVDIKFLTIDSRNVSEGALFVCISGFNVDGHKFIKSACEKGAAAVLCMKDLEIEEDVTVIKVRDTREALALISNDFFDKPSEKFKLIGVTGTNGKTSSTYFIETILNSVGRKSGVIGTVETRIGGEKFIPDEVGIHIAASTTPDNIELNMLFNVMAEKNVDNVIMEVSSHALELKKVDYCDFYIGVFTNLTQDHLDLHGNMENYCNAKSRLFKMCKYGIVNADDKYFDKIIKNADCEIITFGIDKNCDIKALNIRYYMDKVRFDVLIDGNIYPFELNIPGRFSVYNALGAIGVALRMGMSVSDIQKGVNMIKGVPGRIQNIKNDKGFNVIVDYAHTPDGLENIINSVRGFTKGKIITVFGCGGDRDRKKRPIMGEIVSKLSDFSVLTSDNPRSEEPSSIIKEIETGVKPITKNYISIVDRKEAIFKAIAMAGKGDSVIIAGKGHEDYEIFADRTIHFDDTEVAKEALDAL